MKILNIVNAGGGSAAELAVNTTWAELKGMRDNSQLTVGCLYRITDYETIILEADVQSAGHVFDIIVLATDVNQLSEDAMAVHSERDTDGYFASSKLEAWELKYCLDNDTSRFTWAGEGKGVIWGMKDEHNNLCPYDFKNVQFKRSLITSTLESPSEDECAFYGKYVGQVVEEDSVVPELPNGYAIDPNDSKYLYTFSVIDADGNVGDYSLGVDLTFADMGIIHLCSENRMQPTINSFSFAMELNNNVFVATYDSIEDMMNITQMGNIFGSQCLGNTFINAAMNNVFGNKCEFNTFGNGCAYNSFGNYCGYNSFGIECFDNSFGNDCYANSFGYGCKGNSFGNLCYNNSFGNDCEYNSFGNHFYNNSFGNSCWSNSFGNESYGNSFGNECKNNSFENNCTDNSFGNNCSYSSFGNNCQYNDILDNVKFITVFGGVLFVSIGSTSGTVQLAQVLNGTRGSDTSNKLQINFATNKNYTQVAGQNSSGELKIWNPADLVQ